MVIRAGGVDRTEAEDGPGHCRAVDGLPNPCGVRGIPGAVRGWIAATVPGPAHGIAGVALGS